MDFLIVKMTSWTPKSDKTKQNGISHGLFTLNNLGARDARALSRAQLHQLSHMVCSIPFNMSPVYISIDNSGFPSTRINLSPFTKDFRGGEQLNESID